ncbi:MAG: NACHT domain-containing protein, partial [Ktedonobacteraceae bacterium]
MRKAPEDGEDLVSWPWKRLCRLMWAAMRLIWTTGIVGIGLNIIASRLIVPSLPLGGTPLGWLVEHPQLTLLVTLVLVLLTALAWLGSREAAYHGSQGGRSAMLQMLKAAYRRDQAASLRGMIRRVELKMREQLDLIPSAEQTPPELHTSAFGVIRGGEQPFHMQIVQAYRQAGERLLVVGAAGAGKSILLYDLALALLDEAEHDKELPLPVIVHLSSWGQRNLSFVEWIALELAQRFRYPRPLWRRWLQEDRLFLILDGLDAVAPAKRGACIEAVNVYSREHVIPLVVCCRLEEYLAAPRQIALQGAVVVQPLEYESIVEYLKDAGANLAPVRTVVERDPELKMLLTSPLMLAIMTSSYRGEGAEDLLSRSQAQWREHIFDHYLQHMLGERPLSFGTPQQFRRWLPWLARQMQGQQHVLYIEQLQSDWLTHRWAKWTYAWLGVILPGSFIGFLVTAFLINFVMPIYDVSGLFAGSFPGVVVGGLLGYESIPRRGESQLGWNNLLSMGARSVLLGLGTALATIFLDLSIRHSFSLALIGQNARVDGIIFGIWIAFLTISLPLTRATTQQGNRSARFLLGISKYFGDNLLAKSTTKTGMLIGISAALIYGLSHELRYGLSYALSNALSYGLSYSLGGVLIDVILTQKSTVIEPTEILVWSWKKFGSSLLDKDHLKRTLTMGLGTLVIIGLSFGLGFGLILGLSFGPQYALIYGLSYGLSFAPILALGFARSFWLHTGLFQGVRSEELKVQERITPNLGIR